MGMMKKFAVTSAAVLALVTGLAAVGATSAGGSLSARSNASGVSGTVQSAAAASGQLNSGQAGSISLSGSGSLSGGGSPTSMGGKVQFQGTGPAPTGTAPTSGSTTTSTSAGATGAAAQGSTIVNAPGPAQVPSLSPAIGAVSSLARTAESAVPPVPSFSAGGSGPMVAVDVSASAGVVADGP